MQNNREVLTVVLSRNYSTGLSVIRSLGSQGYTVDLVASAVREGASSEIASSRYLRKASEIVAEKVKGGDDRGLVESLLSYEGQWPSKPVLIAADDYTASVMDRHRDELDKIFILPGISGGEAGSLVSMMDKSVQGKIARSVGIPTPEEWVISLRDETFDIPGDMIYPCFVKPLGSTTGFKQEMARCDSPEELTEHLKEMREYYADRSVLVQEFMNIETEYDIEGIAMDQEILIPGAIWKRIVAQYDRGVPLAGKTVSLDIFGGFLEKIYAFLREFHYCGMFDLGINVIDGEFYFNELNLRSGGTNYVYFKSGVNLSELYVRAALGEPLPRDLELTRYGKTYLYEKVAWDDYFHENLKAKTLDRLMERSNILIMCDSNDPAPGEQFLKRNQIRRDRRERRRRRERQREKCITSAMEKAGWDREYAEEQIDDARQRLGISYQRYRENDFCLIPPGDQAARYEELYEQYKKETVIVVLSRNYSTGVAVIRSLGTAGFKVDLVASAYKEGRSAIAASSKYVQNAVEIVSPKVKFGVDEELVNALLEYEGRYERKPVLFPTDDYTASTADLAKDRLKKIFIMPEIGDRTQGAMQECMDKRVQSEIASAAGLKIPQEWIVSLEEEEILIPEDMIYPCFVKPLGSISGYKREMKACYDEAELQDHLFQLRRRFSHRSILIQEYLNIDYEIDFSGVCLDQEVIIPAIVRKTNVAQHEKGVTLAGVVVPFEELGEEIMAKVVEALRKYHYSGMFDMELNVVGDQYYFNEINFRSGGPNFSYFMSGVNLPALYVREAMGFGHKPEEEHVKEYGKSFIYEKVAWDDYIYRLISKRELKRLLNRADIRLMDYPDDPEPYRILMEQILAKNKKQRKKRIRKNFLARFAPFLRTIKYIILGYPQTKPWNRRNPNTEKPRVLVTGRNYCTNLSIARSVGEAGYEVEVLRIFQSLPKRRRRLRRLMRRIKPDAYSKYIKAYYICVSKRKNRRILRKLIRIADPDRKMLLIPGDDLMALVTDHYYDILCNYYYLPNINEQRDQIGYYMRKDVQKELARQAGLPVLNSCLIETSMGMYDIPSSITYPCFIKPNVSARGAKGRMRVCENEEELREGIDEYARTQDVSFLVEDYVKIKREMSILGVSTRNGANGPCYFVAEDNGAEEHRGVAITGRILPCSVMQDLIDDCVRFVGSLGFDGLYDVDLVETEDGKVYFVEVNLRYGASGYAFTKCGVNLPAMFADYMVFGKPIDMDCQLRETGKTFVSEKVLIEEYMSDRLTFPMIKEFMKKTDIGFIRNSDDPKAYRHFRKYYPIASILRKRNIERRIRQEMEESLQAQQAQ